MILGFEFMTPNPIKLLKNLELALSQNPGYTHVLDFPSLEIRNDVALFIQKHSLEFGDDFLNGKLFLAARKEPGKLVDTLVGFERAKVSTGMLTIHGIETNQEVKDKFVDWLKMLDTEFKDTPAGGMYLLEVNTQSALDAVKELITTSGLDKQRIVPVLKSDTSTLLSVSKIFTKKVSKSEILVAAESKENIVPDVAKRFKDGEGGV
jgi:hypothetical protein